MVESPHFRGVGLRSSRGFFETVFTPLARRLGGVDPNLLTVASILAAFGAGLSFFLARDGAWFHALGGLLVGLSGAADALDGIVARLHGRTTRLGEILDHFGDRLGEVAILGGLALSPGASFELGAAVVVLTLLTAYLGTQVEATFGVRDYSGPGRAEQIVALVVFALVRAAWPTLAIPLSGGSLSLPNAFLGGLGLGTLMAIAHRLLQARALAARADQGL